jgi:hypothetical protein
MAQRHRSCCCQYGVSWFPAQGRRVRGREPFAHSVMTALALLVRHRVQKALKLTELNRLHEVAIKTSLARPSFVRCLPVSR